MQSIEIISPKRGYLQTLERGANETREEWRNRSFKALQNWRKIGIHVYAVNLKGL
jgi:hypothetical protein